MAKKKKTKKKPKPEGKRSFIRRQLTANSAITDKEIQDNWNALATGESLALKAVKRERTEFAKLQAFNQQDGLTDFYSSQAALLLAQYKNIEQLLGPAGSDWTWPGEHCETLLREAIQKILPPSLGVGKGYVHGIRNEGGSIERCPEIDILIYNREMFAPLFSMDKFVIVYPESVVAAIQVKRSLDANTLAKAVENVVEAKRHVLNTCRFNSTVITEKLFSAIVSFEEGITAGDATAVSGSYKSALQPHITEFHHGFVLPDFICSLSNLFLLFTGVNINKMGYQAFAAEQDGKNVALSALLFFLMRKIRPFGLHLPPAFPEKMTVKGYLPVWEKPSEESKPASTSSE